MVIPIRYTFLLFCFILFSKLYAQTWESMGGGIGATDSGFVSINTMCTYSNKLYVGGMFTRVGSLVANNIPCWNGKNWDILSTGVRTAYPPQFEVASVNTLCVYRNLLFVAGQFDYAGKGISAWRNIQPINIFEPGGAGLSIAFWVDTLNSKKEWFAIGGVSCPFSSSGITSLCVYNDNLYVGGDFESDIPQYHVENLVRWKCNNGWSGLIKKRMPLQASEGEGYTPGGTWDVFPNAMTIFHNKLYIGSETKIDENYYTGNRKVYPVEKVCAWNDTTFHAIAKDILNKGLGDIRCMAVYDSALYVGCHYSDKINTYGILKYDGKNWSILKKDAWKGTGSIFALAVYNNKLYIGGMFDSIDGIRMDNIACWDGKKFTPVGGGFQAKGKLKAHVHALCVYKGGLYAGGSFVSSSGKTLSNIAKLNLDK